MAERWRIYAAVFATLAGLWFCGGYLLSANTLRQRWHQLEPLGVQVVETLTSAEIFSCLKRLVHAMGTGILVVLLGLILNTFGWRWLKES